MQSHRQQKAKKEDGPQEQDEEPTHQFMERHPWIFVAPVILLLLLVATMGGMGYW